MKNSLEILEALLFPDKLDLKNINNLEVKERNLQVNVYWGSPPGFQHSLIYKYEYCIKHDRSVVSLDIYIEPNNANKVLSLLQGAIEDSWIGKDRPFDSIKDNELITRVPLEMDMFLDVIKKDNFLVVQFFDY